MKSSLTKCLGLFLTLALTAPVTAQETIPANEPTAPATEPANPAAPVTAAQILTDIQQIKTVAAEANAACKADPAVAGLYNKIVADVATYTATPNADLLFTITADKTYLFYCTVNQIVDESITATSVTLIGGPYEAYAQQIVTSQAAAIDAFYPQYSVFYEQLVTAMTGQPITPEIRAGMNGYSVGQYIYQSGILAATDADLQPMFTSPDALAMARLLMSVVGFSAYTQDFIATAFAANKAYNDAVAAEAAAATPVATTTP
jgi:hypothetical protein